MSISTRQLARFEPVKFNLELVEMIELAAMNQGLSCKRMTSGAGHDAQMMARVCPSAMIFVPSVDGVSHNPREFTAEKDLLQGGAVLLEVAAQLVLA